MADDESLTGAKSGESKNGLRWRTISRDQLVKAIKAHLGECAPMDRFQTEITVEPDEATVTLNDIPVIHVAFREDTT